MRWLWLSGLCSALLSAVCLHPSSPSFLCLISHTRPRQLVRLLPLLLGSPVFKALVCCLYTFASCPGTIPLPTKAGASLPPNLWILLRPHPWALLQLWCFLLLWISFPFPECDCLSQGLIAMNRPRDQCNSCKDNI